MDWPAGVDRKAFSDLETTSIFTATWRTNQSGHGCFDPVDETSRSPAKPCTLRTGTSPDRRLVQLENRAHELATRNIRLIEGYFLEMALVVAELGRIVRPSGVVVMVNDNVQYHGEEVPVDFILGDFAEQSGFDCTDIWVLPRQGNPSQQMARLDVGNFANACYKWVARLVLATP